MKLAENVPDRLNSQERLAHACSKPRSYLIVLKRSRARKKMKGLPDYSFVVNV
jgi:hypothetical protein